MINSILLQVTQLPQTPAVTPKATESVLEIAMKGGWILVPIAFFSIVAVYVIIDRWLATARTKKTDELVKSIAPMLKDDKLDMALVTCKSNGSPVGDVIAVGLETISRPINEVKDAMESEANQQIDKLSKNMHYLSIISSVAPMFGFLGTIFGVIKIFYNISLTDNISIGIISGGLYQKMISSASGLFVGIIAYTGYHLLNARIDKITSNIERQCNQFIALLRSNS
jgi:biopolymer transport protein ExbB